MGFPALGINVRLTKVRPPLGAAAPLDWEFPLSLEPAKKKSDTPGFKFSGEKGVINVGLVKLQLYCEYK